MPPLGIPYYSLNRIHSIWPPRHISKKVYCSIILIEVSKMTALLIHFHVSLTVHRYNKSTSRELYQFLVLRPPKIIAQEIVLNELT